MTAPAHKPLLDRLEAQLTRDRLRLYPPAILLMTLVLYGFTLCRSSRWIEPGGTIIGHDFLAFYMAGDLVRTHRADELYNVHAQEQYQKQFMSQINPAWEGTCLYLNPPHYAWLLSWLSPLGYGRALLVWWALSLACFAGTVLLWRSWLDAEDWPMAVLLAACVPPFFLALAGGQNSFFTLLILTAFCHLLMNGRDGCAGLVLSLLAYKFQLLVVPAGLLLFKRRWRGVGGLALGGAATLLLTAALLGTKVLASYATFASRLGTLMQYEGFDAFKQHSWYAFFQMVGMGWMPTGWIRGLTLAAGLATLAVLAILWRGRWDNRSVRFPLQLAGLILATAMTSPHLFHYDVLILVLPAVLWRMTVRQPEAASLRPAVPVILTAIFLWLSFGVPVTGHLRIQLSPLLMAWFLLVLARASAPERAMIGGSV
jgi:hypothetical protein